MQFFFKRNFFLKINDVLAFFVSLLRNSCSYHYYITLQRPKKGWITRKILFFLQKKNKQPSKLALLSYSSPPASHSPSKNCIQSADSPIFKSCFSGNVDARCRYNFFYGIWQPWKRQFLATFPQIIWKLCKNPMLLSMRFAGCLEHFFGGRGGCFITHSWLLAMCIRRRRRRRWRPSTGRRRCPPGGGSWCAGSCWTSGRTWRWVSGQLRGCLVQLLLTGLGTQPPTVVSKMDIDIAYTFLHVWHRFVFSIGAY